MCRPELVSPEGSPRPARRPRREPQAERGSGVPIDAFLVLRTAYPVPPLTLESRDRWNPDRGERPVWKRYGRGIQGMQGFSEHPWAMLKVCASYEVSLTVTTASQVRAH